MFIAGSFDDIPAYNPLGKSCIYIPDTPVYPSVITGDEGHHKSNSALIIISSIAVIVLAIGIIAFFIWLVANHK